MKDRYYDELLNTRNQYIPRYDLITKVQKQILIRVFCINKVGK